MTQPVRCAAVALLLLAAGGAACAQQAPAKAGERCEEAVAETVRRMRGAEAQELQFIGAKRLLSPREGPEVDVKGEGRYGGRSGATHFSYRCVFNSQSGATSGVLFRETGALRAGSEAAWQPDLSNFSPDNCESATAAVLKAKYPRVGRITFDPDGRELRPGPNANTTLEGRGAVERALGMNAVPFRFRCEFETQGGKVLAATTTE